MIYPRSRVFGLSVDIDLSGIRPRVDLHCGVLIWARDPLMPIVARRLGWMVWMDARQMDVLG